MSPSIRRAAPALTVLVPLLLAAAPAVAVPVTFQVRMGVQAELGVFDPAADFVDVAGSFNGWGTDPLTPLADADGDTTWSVTVDGFAPGQVIEYKFRYNGAWDGTEEFPGVGNNRVHTVGAGGDSILVWFNDLPPNGDPSDLHWWNDRVFYEIFVRSFQDSDGDGIGDFAGLTARLDQLNDGDPATDTDLGIDGIWLMPINDAPSYHGYDAVDYRAINPDYGTMADFEAFLAAAHARGIKVIVDYVMNHCSSGHPWFQAAAAGDPARRGWFRWEADDPGQTGPWGQQVWHPSGPDWYYGLFWSGMPDLNYDDPSLREEMLATAEWWLEDVGVDGFRLDAVLYIDEDGDQLQDTAGTFAFWEEFNGRIKAVAPAALSVGEAWTSSTNAVRYVQGERLDLCFEFDLSYAVMGAANSADAWWLGEKLRQVTALYPYLQFAPFLTNHDQDRAFTVLGEDPGKARAAAGILLTLPGVPFVYYGEEIGMTGSGAHEFIRAPMQWTGDATAGFTTGVPWQPLGGNVATNNVAAMAADPASLLSHYRRLIRLRQAVPALRRGGVDVLSPSAAPVVAYLRGEGPQAVLCAVNTGGWGQSGLVLGGADALAPGDHALVDLLAGGAGPTITVSASGEITGLDLEAWEVAVFGFAAAAPVPPGEPVGAAAAVRFAGARPNPFNPSVSIRFALAAPGPVRVVVFDAAGRQVAVLQDGPREAGEHAVTWNGRDGRGRPAAAGAYLVRIEASGTSDSGAVTLLK
jgi:alpha-amylase